VDIVLLLDSSGSLGVAGWLAVQTFAQRYLQAVGNSLSGVR
jgi:hypothetical protein